MSFASDKLYNGYLRRKMPIIVTKVKVREVMVHLPCLTPHDRENIEAKRETYGNYDSMVLLLDCLKRRENWLEQFIDALDACEHTTLAAEIRAEYDTLRSINNSNPGSPPTTVVRAHVHPAPSASPPPVPESGANSQAAVAPPAEASAPPEPAAEASPPLETPVQPQVPEAVSPPEPVPEPPQSTQVEVEARPSTPPASPESPNAQTGAAPSPQREVNCHQEPEENSESDIQDVSGDDGVIPDQESAENGEVSIDQLAALQPPQCETDTPPRPDPLQTTTTSAEVRPPRSPSPTQTNSDVTDGSSVLTMTPEKPPVQDTTPPVDLKPAVVLQPEETSEPPVTQVVESSPQTETAAASSPLPGAAGIDASLCDDSHVCLSKPGQLISIHPQNNGSATVCAPDSPVQPYSGDSERLEISVAAPDAVTSAQPQPPACSAVGSIAESTASALPCQENGIALNHNEPEENHYESLCQGVEIHQVLTHVVHVSGEPSILDLDGQSPTQAQIVNGEAAKEIASAPPLSTNTVDTALSVNTPSSEDYHPSEPAPADTSPGLKDSEKKTASCTQPANTKYILTAAGVAACALLLAWRFRN
ncbi:mitochondrial antiviral-signaling protein [Cebidichthys violaceus]|uniref:mitochondrial antiviral-signaling protein n=1 Tax=Cebidichthys violaceus TaxID=271503 RepID=UPI0035CAFFC9